MYNLIFFFLQSCLLPLFFFIFVFQWEINPPTVKQKRPNKKNIELLDLTRKVFLLRV